MPGEFRSRREIGKAEGNERASRRKTVFCGDRMGVPGSVPESGKNIKGLQLRLKAREADGQLAFAQTIPSASLTAET